MGFGVQFWRGLRLSAGRFRGCLRATGFLGSHASGSRCSGSGRVHNIGLEESVEVFPHSVRLSAFIIIIITIFSYTPKPYSHV